MIEKQLDIYSILYQKYKNVNNFSEDYLIWYTIFVYESSLPERLENKKSENHHFLTRGEFPEFADLKKNEHNKAILRSKDHFIAHYLLYKAAPNKVNTFAFNQMKRVLDKSERADLELGSMLYQEARVRISECISLANKGRKLTEQAIEDISKRTKGNVVVYHKDDKDKNMFAVSVDDPKYISGEYLFCRTGTKMSPETLTKMSENSGLINKNIYYSSITFKTRYFGENEVIPPEYIKGVTDSSKQQISERISGLNYYNNPITGEQARFYDGEQPTGWIRGKIFFGNNGNHFSTNKVIRNFITNETGISPIGDQYPKYCGNTAVPENSRYAFLYNNYVAFTPEHLGKICVLPPLLIKLACNRIKEGTADRPIRINYVKKEYVDFLENIKTYNDLGFTVMKVSEFIQMKDYSTYEWVG